MKYFTKDWYAACGLTGYHENMQVSKNAETFSEEYYHDLYLRRRRAFVKERKEEAEKNGAAFDKANVEAEFQSAHEHKTAMMQKRLPEEILKQVADVRVLALDIATKEVRHQLKEICEKSEAQAQDMQEGEALIGACDLRGSRIAAVEMKETQLTFKLSGSSVKKVIFKNHKILEQDGYMLGAELLQQEVYSAEGGKEYHGLLWKQNGTVGYLTIFAEEIEFVK